MKNILKRMGVFTLVLAMVLGMTPIYQAPESEATQTKVDYLKKEWDVDTHVVKTSSQTCSDYTPVTSSTGTVSTENSIEYRIWGAGYYVVNTSVTINERIRVKGEVNLILCDGATLTAPSGIEVSGTNILIVYGQTEGTGSLLAG